ncbi:MAG: hypothetical protein AB7Q97_04825 [Gammaproteobacteria bacterium]
MRIQIALLALSLFGGLGAVATLTQRLAPEQTSHRGPSPAGRAAPMHAPAQSASAAKTDSVGARGRVATALPAAAPGQGRIYIWRSADGRHHITSSPPPPQVPARVQTFAVAGAPASRAESTPAVKSAEAPASPATAPRSANLADSPLRVYTPSGFEELTREAQRLDGVFRDRSEDLSTLTRALRADGVPED